MALVVATAHVQAHKGIIYVSCTSWITFLLDVGHDSLWVLLCFSRGFWMMTTVVKISTVITICVNSCLHYSIPVSSHWYSARESKECYEASITCLDFSIQSFLPGLFFSLSFLCCSMTKTMPPFLKCHSSLFKVRIPTPSCTREKRNTRER